MCVVRMLSNVMLFLYRSCLLKIKDSWFLIPDSLKSVEILTYFNVSGDVNVLILTNASFHLPGGLMTCWHHNKPCLFWIQQSFVTWFAVSNRISWQCNYLSWPTVQTLIWTTKRAKMLSQNNVILLRYEWSYAQGAQNRVQINTYTV